MSRLDTDPVLAGAVNSVRMRAEALCPADAARVVEAVDVLVAEVDRFHDDYLRACQQVAAMHAAAVGEITGPRIGVVEDVEAVRIERDALRRHVDELDAAMGRHPSSGPPRPEAPIGDPLPVLAELLARIDRERRRSSRLVAAGDDLADYVSNVLRVVDPRLDQRLGEWHLAREGTPTPK